MQLITGKHVVLGGIVAAGTPARAWRFVVAAVLLAGALAGKAPSPAHAADLSAALLTADDLPSGWRAADAAGPTPSSYAWCPAGAALPVRPPAEAARSFATGALSPLLYQRVLQFAPGDAARAMAALRAEPGACAWEEREIGLAPMRFQLGALIELPQGEETMHRRLTATWEDLVAEADIVVICQGAFVVILTHVAVGTAPVAPDARLTEWLTGRAASRLAAMARREA